MKHIHAFILLLAGIASACYEDKGTYDYSPILETALASPIHDTIITRGQHLTIVPDLKLLELGNEDQYSELDPGDYSYEWRAYGKNLNDMSSVLLATTRALDTTIYLSTRTEPYRVVYSVTRESTGITRKFQFQLTVTSRYSTGWLYLTEEDDGTAELIVMGTETATNEIVFERDVIERSGFPYRGGGAKFVYWYSNFSRIIIGTGEATGYIDRVNFEWNDTKLVRYMMSMPLPVDHTFEKILFPSASSAMHWVDSRGNIMPMQATVGVMYPSYNILPPAVTGTNKYDTVQVAPFVAGAASSSTGQLVYDTKNKRMMRYTGMQSALKTNLETVAVANQLPNHQIFYMQVYNVSPTPSVVIAKNLADGKYYRYVYSAITLQANPEEILNGQLLEQAKYMECDYVHGFFYMAIGNKLYVFRTNNDGTGELKEVSIVPADASAAITLDEVTYMGRYTTITATREQILVGTYAGTKGSGKIYHLKPTSTEPTVMTAEQIIGSLDRVKSVSRF
ncbi:MAG: hypothetical protein LBD64_05850 [Odoribacteraceae bacterium]|jgi:hypothetical protein|nr:hypothetical protein [Odoribacteraceae bacterium]